MSKKGCKHGEVGLTHRSAKATFAGSNPAAYSNLKYFIINIELLFLGAVWF